MEGSKNEKQISNEDEEDLPRFSTVLKNEHF
jgi:hypothetical protein